MKWEDTSREPIPAPKRCSEIKVRDVRLSVNDSVANFGEQRWQFLDLNFGVFSTESHDSCCLTWPAEAIAKARALLDELEAKLEDQTDEPE